MKCKIKNIIEIFFAMFFVLFTFIVLSLFGYWEFIDNKSPMKIIYNHTTPHDGTGFSRDTLINKTKFYPGEYIYFWTEFCNDRNVMGYVNISILDGVIYNYPETLRFRDNKGCYKRSFAKLVPNLHPGKYKWRVRLIYELNPIKNITVEKSIVSFEILPLPTNGAKNG